MGVSASSVEKAIRDAVRAAWKDKAGRRQTNSTFIAELTERVGERISGEEWIREMIELY